MQCNVDVIFSGCASFLCGWTFLASSSSVIYLKVPFDSKCSSKQHNLTSVSQQTLQELETASSAFEPWQAVLELRTLLMSKSFCCKLWDDLVCFLPSRTRCMRKPKPSELFRKRTVFREFRRFYFSLFLLCSSVRVRDEKHRCDNRCSMGPLKRSKANLRTVMITGFPPLA